MYLLLFLLIWLKFCFAAIFFPFLGDMRKYIFVIFESIPLSISSRDNTVLKLYSKLLLNINTPNNV